MQRYKFPIRLAGAWLLSSAGNEQPHLPVSISGPLAGIRVIDLTVALAGPLCTLLLGGMGAEVIKIDAPGGSDIARNNPPFVGGEGLNYGKAAPGEVSLSVLDRHRNKKSITLDLKSDEGRAIFMDLVKQADVLVENFSVGTAERLGIGFETIRQVNPMLIYASISALGDGHAGIKGMDVIVQAMSGIMEVTGFPDGPPCRVGLPIADIIAPHYGLAGILAALIHRGRTGKGQKVEVNMLDSLVSLIALEHFDVLTEPGGSMRSGNTHDRLSPFGIYPAKDGNVAIAASIDAWAHALFEAMGRSDMIEDPRFRTRGGRASNAPVLNRIIADWSRQMAAEVIVDLLTARNVAAVRVRGPREAFQDPATIARKAVVPLRHPKLPIAIDTAAPGVPIMFSGCAVGYDVQAPMLGQDNDEVYGQLLKLDAGKMLALRAKGIV